MRLRTAGIIVSAAALTVSAVPTGTARLLKDINPNAGSNANSALTLGGKVLFAANDGAHGAEPWITDGTAEGTRLAVDIVPGLGSPFSSSFGSFRALGERAIFLANDGVHGSEPWVTDGTEAGTHMVKDVGATPHSVSPYLLGALDSVVLFVVDDGTHGGELWATDGSAAGTYLVRDIFPGPTSSRPFSPIRFKDKLVFLAVDPDSFGSLWSSDGTEAGTLPILVLPDVFVEFPVVDGDTMWFLTNEDSAPSKLWTSDGTEAGTQVVAELPVHGGALLRRMGDKFLFIAEDENFDTELWTSDGTTAGTHRVKDIASGPTSSAIGPIRVVGDVAYFVAYHPDYAFELWRSDGTEDGTYLVKDIFPGGRDFFRPSISTIVGDVLLLTAHDGEHGVELWRSDGTEAGTFLVQDLRPGPGSSGPGVFGRLGNRLILRATDELVGDELWIGRAAILARQPALALTHLGDDVRALGLPQGIERSLIAKLDAAASALERPNGATVALRMLDAFAREVERHVSEAAGSDLREFATEIQELLGVDDGAAPTLPRPERLGSPDRVTLDRAR